MGFIDFYQFCNKWYQVRQKDSTGKKIKNLPFFYGWVIVFVSGLGIFFSGPGQTYNVSIFINSFIKDFSLSRSLVSLLYSLGSIFAGLVISLIGKKIDQVGHRKMATLIIIVFGAVLFSMSFIMNPFTLFLGFFLIRLLGMGSMVLWPSTLVPKWFEIKRGRALSMMGIGGVAAAVLFPLISTWIINHWGWKAGWQIWTLPLWLFMAPLAWFLIKNDPKEVGLQLDGNDKNLQSLEKDHERIAANSFTLSEARRTSTYWLLLFCLFVPSMIITGITFHMVSIFGTLGLSPTVAATTLSITAIVGFPSTIIAGYIYDKINIRYVMIATFVFYVFVLIWLQYVDSLAKSIVYAVLQGIMIGLYAIMINIVGPNYFGLLYLGSIRGSVHAALMLATAFGPLPIGLAYDYFGGYTEILWILLIFPVLAIVASSLIVAPLKKT